MLNLFKKAAVLATGSASVAGIVYHALPNYMKFYNAHTMPMETFVMAGIGIGLGMIALASAQNLIKPNKSFKGVPKNLSLATVYTGTAAASAILVPKLATAVKASAASDIYTLGAALAGSTVVAAATGFALCYRSAGLRLAVRHNEGPEMK